MAGTVNVALDARNIMREYGRDLANCCSLSSDAPNGVRGR